MRWTERQREMLAAMGHRVFALPGEDAAAADADEVANVAAVAAAPMVREPAVSCAPAPPAALSADIATLGWPELRAAVTGCRACALCESRTQTVFGVGHEQARLMVVGEAPGEQEDLQGEPFVGPSGQLLDNMLRAIGFTRSRAAPAEQQVFIANTLKCRPPRNRNPVPAETAQCSPFLARQIELVRPRVLLAMGRFAAHALLATDAPIGQLRGRVHRWRGTPVVVTYHPAYLLRTLADKARAWDDLVLAADVLAQDPKDARTDNA
jgi:uracil-DNA glycosylase